MIIESAIDWLTITTNDNNTGKLMMNLFELIAVDEFARGSRPKNKSQLGYDGQGTEHCFIGSGLQGFMMRLSGLVAKDFGIDALKLGCNVTRMDLQVTLKLDEYDEFYANSLMLEAEKKRAFDNPKKKMAKFVYIDGRGSGSTLQIGSRTSEKYGRIYDKDKESGEDVYERCWRFEVEYKGSAAVHYAKEVLFNQNDWYIISLVAKQFSAWDIEVNDIHAAPVELMKYRRAQYQKDRTLSWLAKQVSPSIEKLRESGVCLQEILIVLGLSDVDNANDF